MEIIKSKHVGCYGIVFNNENQVLLIKKARGAYKNKLDLPGGGIEYGENAEETLKREFEEEVGVKIESFELKTVITNYVLWKIDEKYMEDLQHIAIIYNVKVNNNDLNQIKKDADGLDSLGSDWYDVDKLSEDDLSPLAICVKK